MTKIIPGKNGSKKDVITQKAASLFRTKGFTGTSMRDIAEAIGIEAPSLYNHIESKYEILKEVCFRIAGLFTRNLREIELSPELYLSKIERIIRFHILMMIREYESVYISDHEWKHLPEPLLSDFKNQRRNYHSRLAMILQQAINKKEIDAVNPDVAVLTILSAIRGIESWHRADKKVDAKLLEEDMVKMLVDGLRYHPAKKSLAGRKAIKLPSDLNRHITISTNRKT
jgi:TetR/AcrR family transcriptional regulator, cholesterol catabolism regulator